MTKEEDVEPTILLEESDLSSQATRKLSALQKGERHLGGDEQSDAKELLAGELPSAIANRVRKMVPDGFVLKEIELSVKLGGTLFGIGVDGTAKIKFGPDSSK